MFTYSAFADEISPDLSVQIKQLQKLGIRYIEARGIDGKNIADYTVAEAGEVKKRLDDSGMKLSAIGSPIGKIQITDRFEPELDRFKNILDLANLFETRYIRMFSFFMDSSRTDEYRGEVMDRWGQYLELAKGRGVVLLHENEKGIYGDTAERCKDLMDTLRCEQMGLTFDPANFVQCQVDTRQAFALLRDDVDYMHIKDAVWETGEVVPSGQGDGNVAEILKLLHDSGWDGFLSLEPHLGDFVGFSDLEEGAAVKKEASDAQKFELAFRAVDRIVKAL